MLHLSASLLSDCIVNYNCQQGKANKDSLDNINSLSTAVRVCVRARVRVYGCVGQCLFNHSICCCHRSWI